jgi:NitT/TauT family transport system ATP-binding protein
MDEEKGLPHAGISTIFGLLEVLDDLSGREDVFKLARSLNYELDDLLPVLEAAEMLGFVVIQEGDIKMTPLGKQIVEEDVDGRKSILRERLLKQQIFAKIIQALTEKKDHRLSRNYFLDLFEEHFSPEESERQLNTVIDWGRYSELLGYNPDTEELYLGEEEEE